MSAKLLGLTTIIDRRISDNMVTCHWAFGENDHLG